MCDQQIVEQRPSKFLKLLRSTLSFADQRALPLLLVMHGLLLVINAAIHSPTIDEVGHLPSGYLNWKGRFDAYRVNPPLVRMVAAVPLLVFQPELQFVVGKSTGKFRAEYYLGAELFHRVGPQALIYYLFGRILCIPFSLIGLTVCYVWTNRIFCRQAAVVTGILWCFCPDILGHGSLFTPDVAAGAAGLCAGYALWCWLGSQSWISTISFGASLSFCVLTKFTWLGFCLLVPVVFLTWKVSVQNLLSRFLKLGLVVLIVVYFVNAQYQFSGTGQSLKSLHPVSKTFSTLAQTPVLADLPIPLPEDLVLGVDVQKVDFESKLWSYFCGEWRRGGWWNYYLTGMLLKLPVGFWLLFALGAGALTLQAWEGTVELRTVVALVLPSAFILLFISSQTGFNHHIRYAIPAYPFMFIIAGAGVHQAVRTADMFRQRIGQFLVATFIASSLLTFPHSLSYFSCLCGGPKYGHFFLANSNVDWGQDIFLIELWKRRHPDIEIDGYVLVYPPHRIFPEGQTAPLEPTPGWYIVSLTEHHSPNDKANHQYFLNYEPVDAIGWSTLVYHIPESVQNNEL